MFFTGKIMWDGMGKNVRSFQISHHRHQLVNADFGFIEILNKNQRMQSCKSSNNSKKVQVLVLLVFKNVSCVQVLRPFTRYSPFVQTFKRHLADVYFQMNCKIVKNFQKQYFSVFLSLNLYFAFIILQQKISGVQKNLICEVKFYCADFFGRRKYEN